MYFDIGLIVALFIFLIGFVVPICWILIDYSKHYINGKDVSDYEFPDFLSKMIDIFDGELVCYLILLFIVCFVSVFLYPLTLFAIGCIIVVNYLKHQKDKQRKDIT